jgi:hypothetical protein
MCTILKQIVYLFYVPDDGLIDAETCSRSINVNIFSQWRYSP